MISIDSERGHVNWVHGNHGSAALTPDLTDGWTRDTCHVRAGTQRVATLCVRSYLFNGG